MTHYLAELYTPTPAWLALSQTARQQFFEAIGTGMANLAALGWSPSPWARPMLPPSMVRPTLSSPSGAGRMPQPSRPSSRE